MFCIHICMHYGYDTNAWFVYAVASFKSKRQSKRGPCPVPVRALYASAAPSKRDKPALYKFSSCPCLRVVAVTSFVNEHRECVCERRLCGGLLWLITTALQLIF